MNIQYLKYAVEIAKRGSINKASEELFVAQPNLSRAIKELEKELNIIIFDRNAKGMTLTPDGERLVHYGKRILSEIDAVERTFKNPDGNRKRFSISVPRASYIGEAFAAFTLTAAKENDVEIMYKETNSSRAIKNIQEENYNLGIIRYAEGYDKYYKQTLDDKDFAYELITEFRYVLIMNKDCPLAKQDEILYSDLENYIEIAHADPYVPALPLAAVKREELPDNIRRRVFVFERASQFEVLSTNKEAFMWVSPVPDDTIERYGLVQRICKENVKVYKDVMIRKKNYEFSDLDKAFITELCKLKRKIFEK